MADPDQSPGRPGCTGSLDKPSTARPARQGASWYPGQFLKFPAGALERIEQTIETENVPSAVALYVAFVRLADRDGRATMAWPVGYLAKTASLSRRTVLRRLADLEKAGVVTVERTKIEGTFANGVSHYTLATLSHEVVSLSHQVVPSNDPQRGTVLSDYQTIRREPASHKPIGTAERIKLERQQAILQSKLEKLKAEVAFVSGDERTRVCSDITSTKAQLAGIERRLLQ